MEPTDEPVELVERVAALDVGKATVTACVRVPCPGRAGRRQQEVREYLTLSRSLLELADWLRCERVELVAMEATSDYWKPVFYLLEAEGFTCWLLNAKHVRNVPGRPKTDKLEARKPARRVAREVWGHSFDELVSLVDPTNSLTVVRTPTVKLDYQVDQTLGVSRPTALAEEVLMAAEEASRFVRRAGVAVTPELLEQLDADVRSLAIEYLRFPPYAVFRRIATLRSDIFDLLDRHPRPEYVRDLYRVAGRVSAMLAHASNDLGHPDAADAHARTAWLCADLAGDRRLGAYIRWVQSSEVISTSFM